MLSMVVPLTVALVVTAVSLIDLGANHRRAAAAPRGSGAVAAQAEKEQQS